MCRSLNLFLLFLIACSLNAYNQEKSFSTENSIISYQTFGEGSPILIINGGPGMSSEGFIPLAKLLSKNNTTIVYDQRGTGDSKLKSISSSTITMDLMAKDIEKLRNHLGYKNWIILGHSFGGMLAYYYASKFPKNVRAMIQSHSGGMDLSLITSLDINARLTASQRDSLQYYSRKLNRGDTTFQTKLKRGEFLAPAYVYNKKFVPEIAKRLTQGNRIINSLVWNDLNRINFDTKPEMSKFLKPVLILQGQDDAVPVSISETADNVLPNSKLIIMDKCGHYGWLDRPDIYLKEVEAFLQELN